MRRTWLFALLGVAFVAAAAVWLIRAGKQGAPREPISEPRVTKRAPPLKPLSPENRANCAPLPGGGFSCGACRDDTDCPASSSCILNLASGRTECQGSSCRTDDDCERGLFCRVVSKTARNEALRACVPGGARPAGAACDPNNATDPSVSCGPKLMCVNGGCAPPCEPRDADEEPSCPGQLPCIETATGWGCIPSCKLGTPCGDGKTCSFLSVENPTALCTYADGPNCLGSQGGCPATTDCVVETNARAERTTFRCYDRCTPGAANQCKTGSVCVPGRKTGHCRRACSAGNDAECGGGQRCVKTVGDAWFCSAT